MTASAMSAPDMSLGFDPFVGDDAWQVSPRRHVPSDRLPDPWSAHGDRFAHRRPRSINATQAKLEAEAMRRGSLPPRRTRHRPLRDNGGVCRSPRAKARMIL